MNQPLLPDGRMAKWILLLTLLLALIGRLAAGQAPAEAAPAPRVYEKVHRASVEVVVDGHIDGRARDGPTGPRIEARSPVAGRCSAACPDHSPECFC